MKPGIITSKRDLHILEPEWNRLLRESNVDTLFLTWEWITAWLKSNHTLADDDLMVITIRSDSGSLVGIAPFYKAGYRFLSCINVTLLRVLGDEGTGSEYPAMIVKKDASVEVITLILAKLRELQHCWDLIWMPRQSGWDGQKGVLAGVCRNIKYFLHFRERSFSYFDLPDTFDEFESSLSSNRRQQFRRQAKKINKDHRVEIISCQNTEELSGYLNCLFELHEARRRVLGDVGTFKRKPQQLEFYRHFTTAALANDWLWFYALKVNDEIKAIQIGYLYNDIFYQLQEGFDPDFLPGAGNILRLDIIRKCIDKRAVGYDFLGDHTEHKRRWTARERKGQDTLIGKRSMLNRIIFFKPFWPTGRYFKPLN